MFLACADARTLRCVKGGAAPELRRYSLRAHAHAAGPPWLASGASQAQQHRLSAVIVRPLLSSRRSFSLSVNATQFYACAAEPSRLVIDVQLRARGRLQLCEWHVATQEDLDRYLRNGSLFEMDAGGKLGRQVVRLWQLAEQAPGTVKNFFQSAFDAGAVESASAAIANLAKGTARESTHGIAADKLVQERFGVVNLLLDGEPVVFDDGERVVLEVDGLLGTQTGAWVLFNSAKLTAGNADVLEALGSARKLHSLLRHPVSNSPAALAAYAHARVHAFLSASHFLPGVLEYAVKEGVTPVQCSGARYHVPPQTAPSFPAA